MRRKWLINEIDGLFSKSIRSLEISPIGDDYLPIGPKYIFSKNDINLINSYRKEVSDVDLVTAALLGDPMHISAVIKCLETPKFYHILPKHEVI